MRPKQNYLSAPETVFYEVTTACNYRCMHCFGDYGRKQHDTLTVSELFSLVDQLAAMNVFRLIFGGGEPLLDDRIYDVIPYAVSRLPFVSLSTNGHLATPDVIDRLKDCGLKNVQISLDSAEADAHDCLRNRPGAFDHAIRAIQHFNKAGFRVMTSTVVTTLNAHELDAIITLCDSLGVVQCKFLPLGLTGRALEHPDLWPEKSVAQAAASVLREHVGESVWNSPRTGMKIAADPRLWFKAHPDKTPSNVSCTWDCEAARTCIGILTDGRVVPCVPLGRLGVAMGSLRDASLQDIWQSETTMRLRNNVNMEQGECASCDLRFGCRGGCKANVLAATGTFGGPDPDMRGICPL